MMPRRGRDGGDHLSINEIFYRKEDGEKKLVVAIAETKLNLFSEGELERGRERTNDILVVSATATPNFFSLSSFR